MPTIIRPDSMPRLWGLNPWASARYLHAAAVALKAYADRVDRALDMQARVICDQSAEIVRLRRRVADLHDSIILGRSITPDAQPFDELDDHA